MADRTATIGDRPTETAEVLVGDGLVTVLQAAAFLSLSRSTIYSMMDRGELPFVKLGQSRRIPKHSLVQLAARELRGGGCRLGDVGAVIR